MTSACKTCPRPGQCCRYFVLQYKNHRFMCQGKTRVEVIDWLREYRLPFYPLRLYEDGHWTFGCLWITKEGRCTHYRKRPKCCRSTIAGKSKLCTKERDAAEYIDRKGW